MSSYVHIWVVLSFHLPLCFFQCFETMNNFTRTIVSASFLPSLQTCVINYAVSPAGGAEDQSTDDGVRHNHGRIPTTGRQGQLLPNGRLQSRRHHVRHRFPHR